MGKRIAVVAVAIVLAAVAGFSVWRYLASVDQAAQDKFTLVDVYRAAEDLPAGVSGDDVIANGLFVKSSENRDFLPGGDNPVAIASEPDLRVVLENRIAIGPIAANEILTSLQWEDASDVTASEPLSERIPRGRQAMSLQVASEEAVGGFPRPGDRINVLVNIGSAGIEFDAIDVDATREEVLALVEASEQSLETRFVLQGLEVLAVGEQIVTGDDDADHVILTGNESGLDQNGQPLSSVTQFGLVTVAVTADEAERLVYATLNGDTYFTLVPDDFTPVATTGITRENLFE